MTERIIHQADLSRIESNLQHVAYAVSNVDARVNTLEHTATATHFQLVELKEWFQSFVEADRRAKNVQLAETRLVKVRQELENRFGHHAEVRRRTTGLLQAVEVGLVQQQRIGPVAEEVMLQAPGYWLAPTLVALSAWISDNRPLAERAFGEGLRRNPHKAALFFSLVSRRCGRFQVSRHWLDLYFGMVNPVDIDREMVVILNGYVSGVFGPDADGQVTKHIAGWIDNLSMQTVQHQRQRWAHFLSGQGPLGEQEFPYLRRHSPTWPQLEAALQGARHHRINHDRLAQVFTGETPVPPTIGIAVDHLLDRLIAEFDHDELPFRRDERLLHLIIEKDGDRVQAEAQFEEERSALTEKVDLAQRVTDWALHPGTSGASLATQRFAIALSRKWILSAHHDVRQQNHWAVPSQVDLQIDEWTGMTVDGHNETDLLQALDHHIDHCEQEALRAIRLRAHHYLMMVVGGAASLYSLLKGDPWPLALAAILFLWVGIAKIKVNRSKVQTAQEFERRRETSSQILRALCAEVVDWRAQYASADAEADSVRHLLEQISPEQHVASGKGIDPSPGHSQPLEPGIASQFPDWDLLPLPQITRRRASV